LRGERPLLIEGAVDGQRDGSVDDQPERPGHLDLVVSGQWSGYGHRGELVEVLLRSMRDRVLPETALASQPVRSEHQPVALGAFDREPEVGDGDGE